MSNPAILVEDFFRLDSASVTDPGAATGKPASRLRDSADYLAWTGADSATVSYTVDLGVGNATEANAFAIIGSNMNENGCAGFYVQYSDNGSSWTTQVGVTTPADRARGDLFTTFDGAGAHRYWRVNWYAATSAHQAREIYLGRRVDFPEGIATVEGWDPRAEVPVNRSYRSEQGYIVETISDFIGREPQWTFKFLLQSFWDDETEWTGFRWWWDNYALQGKMGVFMWAPGKGDGVYNPGASTTDFEWDGLFGMPIVSGSPTLETSVDRGYRGVSFRIRGRYDG